MKCTSTSSGNTSAARSEVRRDFPKNAYTLPCRNFSTATGCRFGSRCKFLHIAAPSQASSSANAAVSASSTAPSSASSKRAVAAKVVGAGLPFHILLDKEFRHSGDIRKFMDALLAEDPDDALSDWGHHKNRFSKLAELLLADFSQPARVSGTDRVSFDEVIVPLIEWLSSPSVVNCGHGTITKKAFQVVMLAVDRYAFMDRALSALKVSPNVHRLTPFVHLVAALIKIADIEISHVPAVVAWITTLESLLAKVGEAPHHLTFILNQKIKPAVRRHIEAIGNEKELTELKAALKAAVRSKVEMSSSASSSGKRSRRGVQALLEDQANLPGELRPGGLPRHENDKVDYRDISIIPMASEFFSQEEPYVPIWPPVLSTLTRFVPDPVHAYLSSQFRLYREDCLYEFRIAVHRFLSQCTLSRMLPTATFVKLCASLQVPAEQTRILTTADNDIRLQVFRNARLLGIHCNMHRGIQFQVEFDSPSETDAAIRKFAAGRKNLENELKMNTQRVVDLQKVAEEKKKLTLKDLAEAQEEISNIPKKLAQMQRDFERHVEDFWTQHEGSKLLQDGNLVAFAVDVKTDNTVRPIAALLSALLFGVVEDRKGLYDKVNAENGKCRVKIRFLENDTTALVNLVVRMNGKAAAVASGIPCESVLLELKNLFFRGCEPVLNALQKKGVKLEENYFLCKLAADLCDEAEERTIKSVPAASPYLASLDSSPGFCSPGPWFLRRPEYHYAAENVSAKATLNLDFLIRTSNEVGYVQGGPKTLRVKFSSSDSVISELRAVETFIRLDATQIEAFAAALTRQVGLIQGPPGTGKTYVGVQILNALIVNGLPTASKSSAAPARLAQPMETADVPACLFVTPILIICYTNHALDSFLLSLLASKCVQVEDIVRGGSRSKEKILQARSINELCRLQGSRSRAESRRWFDLKNKANELEAEIRKFEAIDARGPSSFERWWKESPYEDLYSAIVGRFEKDEEGFQEVTDGQPPIKKWLRGFNRNLRNLPLSSSSSSSSSASPLSSQALPSSASGQDRSVEELLENMSEVDVWTCSVCERERLHSYLRVKFEDEQEKIVKDLFQRYSRMVNDLSHLEDLKKKRLLASAKVLAFTTSACSSHQGLLNELQPKVIICEEAGEVCEAHITASLTAGTEHLILIGDHLQLRPKVKNFSFSSASCCGIRLDMSMFERLIHFHAADITEQELCITESMSVRSRRTDSDDEGTNIGSGDRKARTDEAKNETGNEEEALGQIRGLLQRLKVKEKQSKVVVTLQTQRRMHPTISQFLRQSLYPRLEDATVVKGYPSVKGVKGRLNFFTHTFPDTSSNKGSISNVGEAQLVVQFVKYMILQGYKGSHEIVVLTPYVGQILVLRRLLQEKMKIFTEISEADNDELVALMDKLEDKTEAEEASKQIIMLAGNVQVQLKNEKLEQCIRLATVDNFQGEEADIVIVSTVRCNKQGRCGFLKEDNRVNVMLSRAKHGMFVFGSEKTIRQCGPKRAWMFNAFLDYTDFNGWLNPHTTLKCQVHGNENCVESAEAFSAFSDGGCTVECRCRLACGHKCSRLCHADDVKHIVSHMKCKEDCARILICGHPCLTLYSIFPCPPCPSPVTVALPCGHVVEATCGTEQTIKQQIKEGIFKCQVPRKQVVMPLCGHTKDMVCWQEDAISVQARGPYRVDGAEGQHALFSCEQPCGKVRKECSHHCESKCGACCRRTLLHVAGNDANVVVGVGVFAAAAATVTLWKTMSQKADFEFVHAAACKQACQRDSNSCHHRCPGYCHKQGDCPPCEQPCVQSCEHSPCGKKCSDPCDICVYPCSWTHTCGYEHEMVSRTEAALSESRAVSTVSDHGPSSSSSALSPLVTAPVIGTLDFCLLSHVYPRCDQPCGAPCTRLPCDKRCAKLLTCGHQCPACCGETCPSSLYCRQCYALQVENEEKEVLASKTTSAMPGCTRDTENGRRSNIMQQQCDMIEMTDLHEHNPTDSALIVLSCGHAFTIGTLDHVIGIDRGYTSTVNENTGLKEFVGLRDVTAIKEIPQFPKCLTCKALSFDRVKRYGRLLKRAHLWRVQQLFCHSIQKRCAALENQIRKYAEHIDISIHEASTTPHSVLKKQLQELALLDKGSLRLLTECRNLSPFQKVYEMEKAWRAKLTASAETRRNDKGQDDRRAQQADDVDNPAAASADVRTNKVPESKGAQSTKGVSAESDTLSCYEPKAFVISSDPLIRAYRVRHLALLYRVCFLTKRVLPIEYSLSKEHCVQAQEADEAKNAERVGGGGVPVFSDTTKLTPRNIDPLILSGQNWRSVLQEIKTLQAAMEGVSALWVDECSRARSWMQRAQALFEIIDGLMRMIHSTNAALNAYPILLELENRDQRLMLDAEQRIKTLEVMMEDGNDSKVAVNILRKEIQRMGGTERLRQRLDEVRDEVRDSTWKSVYAAMAPEVGRGVGSFGGHIYQCPNGHVYYIGECGGAMEESKCADCGAIIGGSRHTLLSDNGPATQFIRVVSATPPPLTWREDAANVFAVPE